MGSITRPLLLNIVSGLASGKVGVNCSIILFRPLEVLADNHVIFYFLQSVQLFAQDFDGKLSVDKRMAFSADVDAILLHFYSGEVLFKPFVGMASPWYQMVECNRIGASA